ncbi:MAG: hypothetical protein NUV32_04140 [Exilispira sp.]|nr:hypothetical protein [Exilispira sp.]
MKKFGFALFIFIFFIFVSCNTTNMYVKSSWVERLTQKIIVENDYLYAECAYVDKESMIKNIASEGTNPFIYRDALITKQESILFSLLIVPKVNFEIYAEEVYIKTEIASYPILFSEYVIDQNMYESEIDSVTKKMKEFVKKYFLSKKESYKIGERKVRFLYSIVNIDYKGAMVRVPIHVEGNKISVLNFVFPEIKR